MDLHRSAPLPQEADDGERTRDGREAGNETAFVGAVTGPANLAVSVTCRDNDDLCRYATRGLGSLDAIRALEIAPALRLIKRAGTIMDGDRLPDPLAEPAVSPAAA